MTVENNIYYIKIKNIKKLIFRYIKLCHLICIQKNKLNILTITKVYLNITHHMNQYNKKYLLHPIFLVIL